MIWRSSMPLPIGAMNETGISGQSRAVKITLANRPVMVVRDDSVDYQPRTFSICALNPGRWKKSIVVFSSRSMPTSAHRYGMILPARPAAISAPEEFDQRPFE